MSDTEVRLIDANSFKRFLQALCKAGAPYDDVIQLLDKTATAYDVEKVVAELEEWTFNADVNIGDGTVMNHNLITSKNAIDIVRKGGVE